MNKTEEKRDCVQKEFLAFPDIAADTINALLYRGCGLAEAEKLWPGPTETIYQGRERLRDVSDREPDKDGRQNAASQGRIHGRDLQGAV